MMKVIYLSYRLTLNTLLRLMTTPSIHRAQGINEKFDEYEKFNINRIPNSTYRDLGCTEAVPLAHADPTPHWNTSWCCFLWWAHTHSTQTFCSFVVHAQNLFIIKFSFMILYCVLLWLCVWTSATKSTTRYNQSISATVVDVTVVDTWALMTAAKVREL